MKTSFWEALRAQRSFPLAGWAILLLGLMVGCSRPMSSVRHDLASEGYVMWYPAETGIEPGQIWLYDGTLRKKFAEKPASVQVAAEKSKIGGRHWSYYGEAETSFDTEFTNSTISKAGPFAAELHAATVEGGTIQFGQPRIVSLAADALTTESTAQIGPGYARAVELVREGKRGLHLVASVVEVDSVVYTLACKDPYLLVRQLPRIRSLVEADITVEVIDAQHAKLTLRPKDGAQGLVIGVLPIRGKSLDMPVAEARRAMGAELQFAAKQNYAFPADLSLTVVGAKELIEKDDSAETVDEKYRRATIPKAAASSGNELPPAKVEPATKPSEGQ